MQQDSHGPKAPDPMETDFQASYFLNFHDAQFLEEVYRNLLKREPDPPGYSRYIYQLRLGESRYRILRDISRSGEARQKNVTLRGMSGYSVYRVIEKIPVLGSLVILFFFFLRIKSFLKELRALENHAYRLTQATELD